MEYYVRNADIFDIGALMTVEHLSFPEAVVENEAVFAERLRCAPLCNFVLISSAQESVCGYLTAELWNRAESADELFVLGHSAAEAHSETGTTAYISSFAVLPDVRGKKIHQNGEQLGLARFLFRTALQRIQKSYPHLEHILLLVCEDWKAAIRIYESEGFSHIDILKHFDGFEGKQAFVYKKTIR